ncbi:MAG: cold-shock protein [Verrucomicrobiota bacterium]|nr:cold-shock protein [Verrucomicrobiota bacterium]
MATGTVKFFHDEKGYGYIAPDDGGRDIFFDSAQVQTPDHKIMEGQRVEYEATLGRKGPEAIKIKTVS